MLVLGLLSLAAGLACSGNRPPRPPGFGNSYPITLAYDAAEVRTGTVVVDGKPYVRIAHLRITSSTRRVNSPLLPQDLVTVALPPDATNVRVLFQAVSAATVAIGRIQPVPPAEPTSVFEFPKDGLPYDRAFKRPAVVPDEQTYASGAPPYPREVATLEEVATRFGARVAVIRVSPFVYYPGDERTELRTSIRGVITFDSAGRTQKLYADLPAPRNRALANIVANPIVIAQPNPATLAIAPLGATADYVVPDVRPAHHDHVDYVIVTRPALVSAFQQLADWKTGKGLDARIVTVDWIESRYAGVDLANKIRNFILDATAKWGASWFLLGGDVEQVPARFGVYDSYTSSFGPADLYFSGHGNFWNANGNHTFGEGSEPDIYPDVFVGRASVTDAASVANFVSKVKSYEINPPSGYGDRPLLMGVHDNLGSDWIKENYIKPLIPGVVKTMYDSGSTLAPNFIFNSANAIAQINTGYHILNHLDHSGVNSLGTGSNSAGGSLGLSDADSLTNGLPGSILWSYGCDPNAFDYDSISEHLMRNPGGGTVAFIGNSRTGWTTQWTQDHQFFKSWFVDHLDNLGAVFSTTQGADTYASGSMNLLGDPAMSLWNTQPATLNVSGFGTITTGANALNLTVTGLAAGAEATVAFRSQNGDVYAGGTTSGGVLNGTFVAHSTSPVDVVITSRDRRAQQTTLAVTVSPNAHLYVSSLQVIDSFGTANSQLEPGESATLRITIVNGGGSTSAAGTAVLATSTTGVTISSSTQTLSALAPSTSQTVDFPIALANNFADGAALLFTLATNGAGTEQTALHVPVFAPVIEQTQKYSENFGNGDDIPTAGDVLTMELHVINNGFGDAHQLAATLSTTSPQITITDATSMITTVPGKGDMSPGDPFGLTLGSGFDPNADLVTMTMTDSLGNTWTRTIKLVVPPPPTGIAYRSTAASITPLWDASALAIDRNYKVYRSPVFNAPVKLEKFLVRDGAYYEDTTISSSQSTYFYDIATIDSYGNESLAAQVQTWASLPVGNGFPRPIDPAHGTITGHTVVYDVDGDGQKEIFVTTGDPGVLYAWKSDGNEFIPGWDPNFAEFATLDGSNGGAPVFADLNQDGAADIIVNGKNRIYAFNADGSAVAGWSGGFAVPNLCNGTPPAVGASSPAVGDVDGDGLPDIITTSFDWTNYACGDLGHVYVLDHNGVLTATYTLPNGNYSYATPALADLNNDAKLEAVIPVRSGAIYVLDTAAGTFLPIVTIPGAIFRNEASLADLDGDGALDIIVASQSNDRIYAVKLDGTPVNGWAGGLPLDAGDHMISQWSYGTVAAVGDVDCDDRPEVALGTEQHVYLWEHDGTRKNAWPVLRENKPGFAASAASPLLADVNGDGRLDVVTSSSTLLGTGLVYAWDGRTGAAISAFPQSLPEMISRTGTLGDIDGDGFVDLVQGAGTHMYAFRTDGRALDAFQPWPRIDRDASNTSTLPAQDLGAACCTPPPPGLAAWWPLNETSGPAAADLAGGHDGLRQNGVASVAGIVGAAASFNGTNGYVTVPHDPALDLPGQFTIDFWIRPDLGETQGTIYRKGALSGANALLLAGAGFHLYFSSGHFLGHLSGTSSGIQTDFSPLLTDHADPGKWTFVALAIDQTAATSTLYIDGHLANTQPLGNVGSMANTSPVLMGGADIGQNAARNFAGALDEVEFTPRALTLAEVEALYAAGPAGKCGSVECLGARTLRIGSGDGYAAFHPDPLGAMFGCNPSGAGDASLKGIRFDPPGPIPESNFSCTSMLYVFDQAGTRRQLLSIHDAPTNNCPCTANPGPAGACYYEPLCPPNDVAHMTCADVLSDTGVAAVGSTQMQRITEFTMPNFPGLAVRLVQDGFKDRLVQRYEFTNNTAGAIHLRLSRVGDLDVNYIDDGNGNLIPDATAYTKNVPAFVAFGAEVHDNLATPQVHVRITAPSGSDATFDGARLQGNGGSAQGRTWWSYGVPPAELGLYGLDSDYWFTTWTGDPATPSPADQAIVIQSLLTIPAGQTRTYVTETSLQ